MHRIDWTQKGEHFAVSTDGTIEDAMALMVNARANVDRERDGETHGLLNDAANALGKLAEHLIPDGTKS
jgi:hypothetical protein